MLNLAEIKETHNDDFIRVLIEVGKMTGIEILADNPSEPQKIIQLSVMDDDYKDVSVFYEFDSDLHVYQMRGFLVGGM